MNIFFLSWLYGSILNILSLIFKLDVGLTYIIFIMLKMYSYVPNWLLKKIDVELDRMPSQYQLRYSYNFSLLTNIIN